MTIIEVDGIAHQPYTVDQLDIFAAQRYSFVLTANQPVKNYWIRAQPEADQVNVQGWTNGMNMAMLHYVDSIDWLEPPITFPAPSLNPLKESDLHGLTNPAAVWSTCFTILTFASLMYLIVVAR